MTDDLTAFRELIEAVRKERPYTLGRNRWHIDTPTGPACRTRALMWGHGNTESVEASEIPICGTCTRIQLTRIHATP